MGLPHLLRCLGKPQLISPGGEPVRLKVRKHLGLLVYLALEPHTPQRRERLADLLWPGVSPTDGRHSLATAISVLRARLGRDVIRGDRDNIQFAPTGFALDLDRLAAGKILGDEFTPPLEIAGFLEDFDIGDAPEFMHWRERQRGKWLPAVRDALVQLINRCRRVGDFKGIERLGDSLLEIDELSEEGVRAKMEARAFDGDRVTALKVFQVWKGKLAEELQAEPSVLLEGMATRLRRRGWDSGATDLPAIPTEQWRGRSFIGRAKEYSQLYDVWESRVDSTPKHALVIGDSGIGKSTLLERILTAAGLEGGAISRTQAFELEKDIPYAVLGGLVQSCLANPYASATPPELLAELARTVPEVRQRFPGIPVGSESRGEIARIRLAEAFRALVRSISEEQPVIIAVDDVHFADDASLAILHLFMKRAIGCRIMVIMAARAGELKQSPHAVSLIENAQHLNIQVIGLTPMSRAESSELLRDIIANEPQPPFSVRKALLSAADGYPMVLEFLAKDWQSNGDQCIAFAIGAMTEDISSQHIQDRTYFLIVERIAQAIDPHVRSVLDVAAILGSRLNDLSLYALADLSVGQVLNGLSQLTDLRVLRDCGKVMGFTNELVRAQCYLAIPSSVRRNLHGNVADRLITLEASGQNVPGLEVAWHLIRAGHPVRATEFLLRGARQAIDRGAPHEAEQALSTGLTHLSEPTRTDALLLLAEAQKEQGKWADVLAVVDKCTFGQDDGRKRFASMLSMEPRRRLGLQQAEDADGLIQDTLSLAHSCTDTHIRIGAIATAALYLAHYRNEGLATELRALIDSIPPLHEGDEQVAKLATARALVHYHDRDISSAIGVLTAASVKMADHGSQNSSRVGLHLALGNIRAAAGQYADALLEYTSAYNMADHLGNDPLCISLASNLAMCEMRLGNYRNSIEWCRLSLERDSDLDEVPIGHGLYHGTIALAMLGDSGGAEATMERLISFATRTQRAHFRQNAQLYLADCHLILGRRSEALSAARKAIGSNPTGPHSHNATGMYARWLALLHDDEGRTDSPCAQLERIVEGRANLDRIDQTEVAAADIWLKWRAGRATVSEVEHFRSELRELPAGISRHLTRLGFLSFL